MKVKAYIFDLDDTLYPELDFVKSGFLQVAQRLASVLQRSQSRLYTEIWSEFEQCKTNVFDRLIEKYCLDEQISVEQLVYLYRNHSPEI